MSLSQKYKNTCIINKRKAASISVTVLNHIKFSSSRTNQSPYKSATTMGDTRAPTTVQSMWVVGAWTSPMAVAHFKAPVSEALPHLPPYLAYLQAHLHCLPFPLLSRKRMHLFKTSSRPEHPLGKVRSTFFFLYDANGFIILASDLWLHP